jgi:hypothetical protein
VFLSKSSGIRSKDLPKFEGDDDGLQERLTFERALFGCS